jgi:hypothetical protein
LINSLLAIFNEQDSVFHLTFSIMSCSILLLSKYKWRLKSEAVEMAVENRDTLTRILWNEVRWRQVPVLTVISGGGKRGVYGNGMVDENPVGGAARGGQQA